MYWFRLAFGVLAVCFFASCNPTIKLSKKAPYSYERELYGKTRTARAVVAGHLTRWRKPDRDFDTKEGLIAAVNARAEKAFNLHPKSKHTRNVTVDSMQLNGVLTYRITPTKKQSDKVLLYYHGGGFMLGPLALQWKMMSALANATGCTVYMVIYRLSGTAPFPAGLNDCVAAYQGLIKKHDPSKVYLIGDSAGGNLVFAAAQKIRDMGIPNPHRIVAISPVMDLAMDNPALIPIERKDPMLDMPSTRLAMDTYADTTSLDHPYVSIIHMDTEGLPPALLLIGTHEILYPDCQLFIDRVKESSYDLTPVVAQKMMHVWVGGYFIFPEGKRGLRQVADYVVYN